MAAINENLSKAIKKTATGLRINSAGDDAAGLAVSEKMRSQIGGLDQAVDNAQDGISLLQTADGGLAETQGILQRMRELSVQAANGALTWQDRSYIQIEVDQLKEEIDRVSNVTQFNKRKLLNGTASGVWSSDRDTTRAIIRGSLTDVDQFGQKNSFEGNYKIDILAVPGEGMVMKSKIFTYITPEDTYGFVGSGLYYDDDGNRLTADGAAQFLTGGFYSLGLVNKEDPSDVARFTLDATSRTFSSMQEVADALTAQAKAKGSKYEFYFDEDAQALAVMGADHDFRVSASQTTINKLFGVTDIPPSHTSGTRDTSELHFIREWSGTPDDVRIDADGIYKIKGNMNSITIKEGVKATIILEDVDVTKSASGECAFKLEDGAEVELILEGTNSFTSGSGRAGIEVEKGSTLKIYESENGGEVIANGGSQAAGIGGRANTGIVTEYNAGDVVIYGGTVRATGARAAGIGAGAKGDAGTVAIHGGVVYAKGTNGAAGIGFGPAGNSNQVGGGEILITGGTIYAEGEDGGAGIGGGFNQNYGTYYNPSDIWAKSFVNYGKITITGGNITAKGSDGGGAGIGGGYFGYGGEITITGGTINAQGGSGGAGIGGGAGVGDSTAGDGGKITITGGDITATGGSGNMAGAGIGGGHRGKGGDIVITGGNITATGGNRDGAANLADGGGAGIGGGGGGGGSGNTGILGTEALGGNIYIVDGVVTAQGGYGAAGIGGGGGSGGGHADYDDGQGSWDSVYDGYYHGDYGANGGETYIYGGKVTATGGTSAAGIGGGTFGTSGKIRIQAGLYGDTVIATRGAFDSNSDTVAIRNHKDVGHGDHIPDWVETQRGGSVDTDADIDDAPGIIGFDSTWSDSEIVERIADSDTALSNIRQLFDETGKSLLTDPQTLTLNLGNGSQTRVTLYADDDLNAVVKKVVTALNGGNANAAGTTRAASSTATTASSAVNAASTNVQTANASTVNSAAPSSVAAAPSLSTAGTVAATLAATPTLVGAGASGSSGSGSGSSSSGYTPPIEDHYTTYIAPGTATPYTSESVEGTLIFRSMPTGVDGALAFAGSRELLESLALNTIQEARENEFIVNITDAHTGRSIVSNLRVTGNHLNGVLHKNVDIEWDDMAGVEVRWNDEQKKYEYTAKEYTTYLHLHDNSTTLQVGANEGDELDISIGDMSAHALGVDKVNVASQDAAARGITLVDNAIDRVSLQRSRLGAWQNRLEHTMNRLEVASENLTAAEIRIRDADMARETMNIAKLKIMLDAGNSVFSQANQLPQHVMSLIR